MNIMQSLIKFILPAFFTLPVMASAPVDVSTIAEDYADVLRMVDIINNEPGTEHTLRLKPANIPAYEKLGEAVGLLYAWPYAYEDFNQRRRDHDIGLEAPEYLLHSSGGSGQDCDLACHQSADTPAHTWQSIYYPDIDMTWLTAVFHDLARDNSWQVLLKLAPGRVPDLHTR